MIDRQFAAYLKLIHGSYNLLILCIFLYQGGGGLLNRKRRIAGKPPDVRRIKRHRRLGKALALLGPMGFLAGAALTYVDEGHLLEYPIHFFFGLTIAVSIITTFIISRKIKGADSRWRTPHFIMGIMVLCLYVVQVMLGLGIFF